MRKVTRAFIAAGVVGLTFGFVLSAGAQTVRVRPGGPAVVWAPDSRIGIASRDVTAEDVSRDKLPGEFGAFVETVSPDGAAEKAGIHAGDVIVEFDGVRVRSNSELQRLVRETPAGRAVKVGLIRAGKRMDVTVTTDANRTEREFRFQTPEGREFVFPMPEFREGPLQVQPSPRGQAPYWRTPRPGTGTVFPGPIPLRPNPWLGIGVQDLTPQLAEYFRTKEGVLVATVEDGSPASRAGLKAGDIITTIDGQTVARADDVSRTLRSRRAGEEVALGIVRDGKTLTIKATLAGNLRGTMSRF